MDAKELRIGNLVFKQGSKLVKQSPEERNQVYMIENVNLQSAKNFSPIPITEERLLDLGFERRSGKEYSIGRFTYRFQQRDLIIEGFENDYNGIIANPDYIHEIQNLVFAISGIEL